MTLSLQEIKEIAIQMRALMPYETESEKFFRHLNNGEVSLMTIDRTDSAGTVWTDGYRITITIEKEDNAEFTSVALRPEKGLPA